MLIHIKEITLFYFSSSNNYSKFGCKKHFTTNMVCDPLHGGPEVENTHAFASVNVWVKLSCYHALTWGQTDTAAMNKTTSITCSSFPYSPICLSLSICLTYISYALSMSLKIFCYRFLYSHGIFNFYFIFIYFKQISIMNLNVSADLFKNFYLSSMPIFSNNQ